MKMKFVVFELEIGHAMEKIMHLGNPIKGFLHKSLEIYKVLH
jgi:hypothetical protein